MLTIMIQEPTAVTPTNESTRLMSENLVVLSGIVVLGLLLAWGALLLVLVLARDRHGIAAILTDGTLLYVSTVALIIGATAVLGLAGSLNSEACAAILAGVAGYVLGSVRKRRRKDPQDKQNEAPSAEDSPAPGETC